MIRLADFLHEMKQDYNKLVKEMADKMTLEEKELKLLHIIINHAKDDEPIDPTTFENDLKKIPMEFWTEEWTRTLGALYKKKLVRVFVKLNTDQENTDQQADPDPNP